MIDYRHISENTSIQDKTKVHYKLAYDIMNEEVVSHCSASSI